MNMKLACGILAVGLAAYAAYADGDEPEAPVRITATWAGGAGSWMTGDWGVEGYPNAETIDVLIDGGKSSESAVTLTLTSGMALAVGQLSVDEADALTVTKNGGNASVTFAGLSNAGTVNANAQANGNQQNVTLKVAGPFENNGVVNLNGSAARNRTTVTFSVDNDSYTNNGTINVTQTAADRNRATLEIKRNGVFVNNGLIAVKLLGTYTGGSGASNARINLGDATDKGTLTLAGSGVLRIYECERTNTMNHKPSFTGGAKSTVVTNAASHTIQGAGNITNFAISNDGLVLADGENLSLNIENTYTDLGGTAMYNNLTGRMVAKGAAGLYLGANTTKNSEFHNLGLLEARTGSFIAFRTGVTEQYNKGTVPTTTAMKQAGTWAGGGTFKMPRPLELLAGSVLKPGDLAGETDESEAVVYGKGESTPGQLTFTNTLKLHETTISEFQCKNHGPAQFDAVWVEGDLTVAGTLRFTAKPHSGTYRIFGATGALTCDVSSLTVECAPGVRAPHLKLVEGTYSVEQPKLDGETGEPLVDDETGEPLMETVQLPCRYLEATWANGLSVSIR